MKKIIVIGGPTASGKTDLAIRMARQLGTGIISADSRQCYCEMTIGTAKPEPEELSAVPHYFINSHHLPEKVNAGVFEAYCSPILSSLLEKNGSAVIAGGTGLYIKSLLEGLDEFPDVAPQIRQQLQEEAKESGSLQQHQLELQSADPEWYSKVDLNNQRRLIRALEIIRTSGRPYSSFLKEKKTTWNADVRYIYLNPDRALLYGRIDQRVDKMMESGLEEEVRALLPWRDHPALHTVGYTELFESFDGKYSLTEAVNLIKQHSRNYAKRQWTWFRNQGNWQAFDPAADSYEQLLSRD